MKYTETFIVRLVVLILISFNIGGILYFFKEVNLNVMALLGWITVWFYAMQELFEAVETDEEKEEENKP